MELGERQPGKDKRREECWCRKLRRSAQRVGGESREGAKRQWGPAHRGISLDCKVADTSEKKKSYSGDKVGCGSQVSLLGHKQPRKSDLF